MFKKERPVKGSERKREPRVEEAINNRNSWEETKNEGGNEGWGDEGMSEGVLRYRDDGMVKGI